MSTSVQASDLECWVLLRSFQGPELYYPLSAVSTHRAFRVDIVFDRLQSTPSAELNLYPTARSPQSTRAVAYLLFIWELLMAVIVLM